MGASTSQPYGPPRPVTSHSFTFHTPNEALFTLLLKKYLPHYVIMARISSVGKLYLGDGVALNELWRLHWSLYECGRDISACYRYLTPGRLRRLIWSCRVFCRVICIICFYARKSKFSHTIVGCFCDYKCTSNIWNQLGSRIPLIIERVVRSTQNSVFTCHM
jgi:hypothetical protein